MCSFLRNMRHYCAKLQLFIGKTRLISIFPNNKTFRFHNPAIYASQMGCLRPINAVLRRVKWAVLDAQTGHLHLANDTVTKRALATVLSRPAVLACHIVSRGSQNLEKQTHTIAERWRKPMLGNVKIRQITDLVSPSTRKRN